MAVSIAPLFPDRVIGGSQRILIEVVDALAEAGHDVKVLCSQSACVKNGFETRNGAVIEPLLQLRGSFPYPYQTAPHRLSSVWKVLSDAAEWADRAYLHADAIYMRAVLKDLPIIRSLHDFVYEEAFLSAFTLPAVRTIVPSEFMRNCILASAGTVADVGEIVVVPNGIVIPKETVPPQFPSGVKPAGDGDLVLLHPHRLHAEKGIEQSMRIAVEVQKRLPDRKIRLLVPALQSDGSLDEGVLGDAPLTGLAESTGVAQLLELHHWLSVDQMPGYLAAGHVTLCPGTFVESFGLVPLESVVAGTAVVCAKVGAFREQQGVEGIRHFNFGDIDAAADAVIEAAGKPFDVESAKRQFAERYDSGRMRREYVETITGPLNTEGAPRIPRTRKNGEWRLAPWCYIEGVRVYHDYLAAFADFPLIVGLLRGQTVAETLLIAAGAGEFERAREHGFIVPA